MYNYPQVFIDWPHPVWSMHQIYWFGAILGAFVQYCSGCPCKPTLFLFGFDTFFLRKRTYMNWFSLVKRILMFYGRGRTVGFLSPVETNPQSMKSSYCTTKFFIFGSFFVFVFYHLLLVCILSFALVGNQWRGFEFRILMSEGLYTQHVCVCSSERTTKLFGKASVLSLSLYYLQDFQFWRL